MMYTASRRKELDKSLKQYRQSVIKNKGLYMNNIHKHKLISQNLLLYERLNILNSWHKKCYITHS